MNVHKVKLIEPPKKYASLTGEPHFGPDNTVDSYKIVNGYSNVVYKNPDILARRHDLDVESALKITDQVARQKELDRVDRKFLQSMDEFQFSHPKKWLQAQVFRTGLQGLHYRKFAKP